MLGNIKRALSLHTYQPLNLIEVSKNRLLDNYKYLSSLSPNIKIAPVLKSNGYGHGLIIVARILDPFNPPFFCVDSLYEAYELLKAGIKTPILIMGYVDPENLKVKKLPFSYVVWDLRTLDGVIKYQPQASIHILIDTGMNREGVKVEDFPRFLSYFAKFPTLQVEGLMSHLSSAKSSSDQLFKSQIKNFQKAKEEFNKFGIHPKWTHLGASDAITNPGTRKIIKQVSNLARGGLALYGISNDKKLKPILKFTTKLIGIKKVKKGERVGYSGTFKAKKDLILGVLPAGYNDGVDRRLSNKGVVTVNGQQCPIIGLISMNLTTIDLSKVRYPKIGTEVVIYSDNPRDKNSISNTAKICKTIPYEILIHLHPSTKRVVI